MSIINFDEYIEALQAKLNTLETKISDLEKQKVEQEMAFELKKNNQLRKEALQVVSDGPKPNSLDLKLPINLNLDLKEEDILQALAQIYKL